MQLIDEFKARYQLKAPLAPNNETRKQALGEGNSKNKRVDKRMTPNSFKDYGTLNFMIAFNMA